MWLEYGVNSQNELIVISEVASGRTNLLCPFCSSQLTAKKGKIKQHHFAHTVETCLRVRKGKLPSLPLYDNFNLQLSAQHFQLLKQLWHEYGNTNYEIITVPFQLHLKKLFTRTPEGFYFTDLGKIPVGGLSLSKFNAVQEPLILEQLTKLTHSVEVAKGISPARLKEKLADLKLYRWQMHRILRQALYFLEIHANGKTLHKIGVTQRTIGDRLLEIERDLRQHYQNVSISIIGTWQHRGNVELYFKHRYKAFNYPIGTLTEYFKFEEVKSILTDLQQMTPKVLKDEEINILQEQTRQN